MRKSFFKKILALTLSLLLLSSSFVIVAKDEEKTAECIIGSEAFLTNSTLNNAFISNAPPSVITQDGEQILCVGDMIMSNETINGNFSVVFDAMVPSHSQVAEISMVMGASFSDFSQVYLHKGGNGNATIGFAHFAMGTWDIYAPIDLGVPFLYDHYYTITVKVAGKNIEVIVDDNAPVMIESKRAMSGRVGLRLTSERPVKNFAVFAGINNIPESGKGATNGAVEIPVIEQKPADSSNVYENSFEGYGAFVQDFDTTGNFLVQSHEGEKVFSNTGVFLSKESYGGEYTVSVDGYIIPGTAGQEISILIGSRALDNFNQIYFRDGAGDAYFSYSAFSAGSWTGGMSTHAGRSFEQGRWYNVMVKVSGNTARAYVDGEYVTTFTNLSGMDFAGKVGIRSDESSIYKNFTVYNSIKDPIMLGQDLCFVDPLEGLVPLAAQEIVLNTDKKTDAVTMKMEDPDGLVYFEQTQTPTDGKYTYTIVPKGKGGKHTITFTDSKNNTAKHYVQLDTGARVDTDDPILSDFMKSLENTLSTTKVAFVIDGVPVSFNATWVRDHIHTFVGSRYFDTNVKDSMQFWLNNQHKDGWFYEYINFDIHPITAVLAEEAVLPIGVVQPVNLEASVIYLQNEADINYLMVEGVYEAWKATADTEWMKKNLAALDRGLVYCMTDPIRWSEEYGLMIRGVSVDTWDWVYGRHSAGRDERIITEESPMAIFHGDNTGLYQACMQLAEMYEATGNRRKSQEWSQKGEQIKENLLNIAWNGNFFAHMVHTNPTTEEAPMGWQEDFAADQFRLSASNTYALTRGILDEKRASQIIETYMGLRDNPPAVENQPEEKMFAEWPMIYPSYQNKEAIAYDVNDYANGSVVPFVAGELMKGAYEYGYEDYGTDILNRLIDIYERDGELCFMYNQNGAIYLPQQRPNGGGTAAWGTSTIFDSIITGLLGAEDISNQYETMNLSPRFASSEYKKANGVVSYGCSDKYVALSYSDNGNTQSYKLTGDTKVVNFSSLLPYNKRAVKVMVNGAEVEFTEKTIRQSRYAEFKLERHDVYAIDTIEITYENIYEDEVADAISEGALVMKLGTPNAYRFDKTMVDPANEAVIPTIINDRTMVPVRFIAESFLADVSWDEAQQLVTIRKGMDKIELIIGEAMIAINGEIVDIDTAPTIKEGRTLVPLRAIAEAMNKSVYYNPSGLIVIGSDAVSSITDDTAAKIENLL